MNINNERFLTYIKRMMPEQNKNIILESNGITFDKCELYSDFTSSILMIVFETYLGDNLTNIDKQIEHFEWCWNKNLSNFKEEGIDFDNLELFNYFLEFTLEVFYCFEDKDETFTDDVLSIWNKLYDIEINKTESDLDSLIEIYKIFEKTLKNT